MVTHYKDIEDKLRGLFPDTEEYKITFSITNFDNKYGWGHYEYCVCIKIHYSDSGFNYSTIRFDLRSTPNGCGSLNLHNWPYLLHNYASSKYTLEVNTKLQQVHQQILDKVWEILIEDSNYSSCWDIRQPGQELDKRAKTGPGIIITTAGDGFWKSKEYEYLTNNLGFQVASEYHNHQHGATGMQRLLILHI